MGSGGRIDFNTSKRFIEGSLEDRSYGNFHKLLDQYAKKIQRLDLAKPLEKSQFFYIKIAYDKF